MKKKIELNEDDKKIIDGIAILIEGLYTDGGHHKQWFMDQAVLKLFPERYEKLREEMRKKFGDDWDKGIAP